MVCFAVKSYVDKVVLHLSIWKEFDISNSYKNRSAKMFVTVQKKKFSYNMLEVYETTNYTMSVGTSFSKHTTLPSGSVQSCLTFMLFELKNLLYIQTEYTEVHFEISFIIEFK